MSFSLIRILRGNRDYLIERARGTLRDNLDENFPALLHVIIIIINIIRYPADLARPDPLNIKRWCRTSDRIVGLRRRNANVPKPHTVAGPRVRVNGTLLLGTRSPV